MRFLGVGFSTILCLLAVVGGVGVAPVVAAAAEPQATAPAVAAAEKEKPKDAQSEIVPIFWPEKYDPRTLKPIRLFMTREEVRKMWGEPATSQYQVRDRSTNRSMVKEYSPAEYADDVKRYGVQSLKDIYYRKTPTNQFQVTVSYKKYPPESQNEDELRIQDVAFFPATRVPIIPTLDDIPEAADVCGTECGMYGTGHGRFFFGAIYPRYPTKGQRLKAIQMTRWKGYLTKEWLDSDWAFMAEEWIKIGDWVPAVSLALQVGSVQENLTLQEVDWMQRRVRKVALFYDTLKRNPEAAKLGAFEEQRTLELGVYAPPGQK